MGTKSIVLDHWKTHLIRRTPETAFFSQFTPENQNFLMEVGLPELPPDFTVPAPVWIRYVDLHYLHFYTVNGLSLCTLPGEGPVHAISKNNCWQVAPSIEALVLRLTLNPFTGSLDTF